MEPIERDAHAASPLNSAKLNAAMVLYVGENLYSLPHRHFSHHIQPKWALGCTQWVDWRRGVQRNESFICNLGLTFPHGCQPDDSSRDCLPSPGVELVRARLLSHHKMAARSPLRSGTRSGTYYRTAIFSAKLPDLDIEGMLWNSLCSQVFLEARQITYFASELW